MVSFSRKVALSRYDSKVELGSGGVSIREAALITHRGTLALDDSCSIPNSYQIHVVLAERLLSSDRASRNAPFRCVHGYKVIVSSQGVMLSLKQARLTDYIRSVNMAPST